MKLKPLSDRVVVKRVREEETTRGGIIIRTPVSGISEIGRNSPIASRIKDAVLWT